MLNRIREAKKNEKGFTLIELLIVIVILGILAAIVVFSVSGITDRGKASACKADVETITVAGEAYIAKDPAGASALDQAALVTAGLIHSQAADVTYTQVGTSNFTAVAKVGTSPC
jgi:general secretion pathway protein G